MSKMVVHGPILYLIPINFTKEFSLPHFSFSKSFFSKRDPLNFKCCSTKNEESKKSHLGFSVLKRDIECDRVTILSNMAFYVFSLHVPLSVSGLAAVANVLHQRVLDPQSAALSLLGLQILELIAILLLLKSAVKPQYNLLEFFQTNELPAERNWLLASVIGFLFILCLVLVTSILADQILGPKEVNNQTLQKLLLSNPISATACIVVYCIVTPFLEELVHRGYLLTSLSCTMKWHQAVFLSSLIFSASHFSGENFLQLFVIGCVLGCSYCWTGNLRSSILIHSLYNAFTLFVSYFS